MNGKLKILQSLDLSSVSSSDVKAILEQFSILITPIIIPKGLYVLRARKGRGYHKRSEMTYSPIKKCIHNQRASLAGETLFYGVISDDQHHQENARAISIVECSSLCRSDVETSGIEYFCVSHWEIIKPLRVVSFVTRDTFPDIHDNSFLNLLRDYHEQAHGVGETTKEEEELARFINQEFSKVVSHDYEYLITATLSSAIIREMKFDGVVFPSVQFGGKAGVNIALTPRIANNKLKFRRILGHTLFKNGKKSIVRIDSVTERNKNTISHRQVTDESVEQELDISISELPIK